MHTDPGHVLNNLNLNRILHQARAAHGSTVDIVLIIHQNNSHSLGQRW